MAVFKVLWPYLLTTKLRSVIRHNLGHSNKAIRINFCPNQKMFVNLCLCSGLILVKKILTYSTYISIAIEEATSMTVLRTVFVVMNGDQVHKSTSESN